MTETMNEPKPIKKQTSKLLDHEEEILKMINDNYTTRDIAAHLATKHGIKCVHTTVRNFVNKISTKKTAVAKQMYREKLQDNFLTDPDIIEQKIQELNALSLMLCPKLKSAKETKSYLDVTKELRSWIVARSELSGAQDKSIPEESSNEELEKALTNLRKRKAADDKEADSSRNSPAN
jgi:hypothetical protein